MYVYVCFYIVCSLSFQIINICYRRNRLGSTMKHSVNETSIKVMSPHTPSIASLSSKRTRSTTSHCASLNTLSSSPFKRHRVGLFHGQSSAIMLNSDEECEAFHVYHNEGTYCNNIVTSDMDNNELNYSKRNRTKKRVIFSDDEDKSDVDCNSISGKYNKDEASIIGNSTITKKDSLTCVMNPSDISNGFDPIIVSDDESYGGEARLHHSVMETEIYTHVGSDLIQSKSLSNNKKGENRVVLERSLLRERNLENRNYNTCHNTESEEDTVLAINGNMSTPPRKSSRKPRPSLGGFTPYLNQKQGYSSSTKKSLLQDNDDSHIVCVRSAVKKRGRRATDLGEVNIHDDIPLNNNKSRRLKIGNVPSFFPGRCLLNFVQGGGDIRDVISKHWHMYPRRIAYPLPNASPANNIDTSLLSACSSPLISSKTLEMVSSKENYNELNSEEERKDSIIFIKNNRIKSSIQNECIEEAASSSSQCFEEVYPYPEKSALFLNSELKQNKPKKFVLKTNDLDCDFKNTLSLKRYINIRTNREEDGPKLNSRPKSVENTTRKPLQPFTVVASQNPNNYSGVQITEIEMKHSPRRSDCIKLSNDGSKDHINSLKDSYDEGDDDYDYGPHDIPTVLQNQFKGSTKKQKTASKRKHQTRHTYRKRY